MRTKLGWWVRVTFIGALAACGGASVGPSPGDQDGGSLASMDTRAPDVSVSETPIDFGFADCGGAAPAQKVIKITNAGGGTVSWTAELESPGFMIVGATAGVFSGGGTVNFAVQPRPIPPSAAAATEQQGTVVVVIDKAKVFRVPLRVTSQGATLSVLPGEAAFGELPINVQAPDLPITIKNTGNKDVTLDFAQPSLADFNFTWTAAPLGVKLAAGATVPGAAARFRPSKLTAQSTSAPFSVKGVICGASATGLPMNGKGTGGVVGISPGMLDWGPVNCGSKGPLKGFSILNAGTAAFNWTGTLASGNFDLSATDGTLLPGNQTTVFVTPKEIPQTSAVTNNLYGDTVTITTTAPNDTPHDVILRMTARGAILAFTATPSDYGVRGVFSAPLGKTATVSNTGNAAATVKLASSAAAYTISPATFSVAGGASANATVNFAPTDFGANSAELSMTAGDVLCQPLPGAAALTGQGKGVATHVALGGRGRPNDEQSVSACAVLTGGHVACWGDNQYGQLGIGGLPGPAIKLSETPIIIPNFAGAVAVAGSGEHNCARTAVGTVYCWGRNGNRQSRTTNQLGTAGGDKATPTLVAGLTNVISLSAAERHTCVVSTVVAGAASGKAMCWGTNRHGNLGTGVESESSAIPLQVLGITDAISVIATGTGGCARRVGNVVSCWGENNAKGMLGNGTTISNNNGPPVAVSGLSNAIVLAGGSPRARQGVTCAAQSTGGVACWGDNKHPNGRYGSSTVGKITGTAGTSSTAQTTPFAIPGVAGATTVAVGQRHMCALVAGGAGKCWGGGGNGELGNGAKPSASPAVDVTGLAGATHITAGGESTCALIGATGAIMCWGANNFGELGNPAATGTTPTLVSGF